MGKNIPLTAKDVSQGTRDEYENLIATCIEFGTHILETERILCPFAVTVSKDGEVGMEGNCVKKHSHWPEDTVDHLKNSLFKKRDGLRMTAVVSGTEQGKYDAFMIEAEHCEGLSMEITVPFVITKDRKVELKMKKARSCRVLKCIWRDEERS